MVATSKSKLSQLLAVVALAIACAVSAGAQSFSASHAQVALLAEDNSLEAGHTAWIGLFFDLEKGWHIYWVNPGDSGEPPRVQWSLPKGFAAGEIRWPVPIRLGTGTVIDYGYQGRVLLPVPLRVPASYQAGAPATLAADVKYLICREVCIPAKAHATLSIPAANRAPADAATARELFRDARKHWPKPMPAGWKAQASDEGRNFVLSLETGSQEAKASFFPLAEDQVDNAATQTVKPAGRGMQITLKKSDQLLKPLPVLKGVVVLGSDHSDRAYEIAAPVAVRH